MRVLGIVAEYNPFHNGHAYHLSRARELVCPWETLVALSPCMTQRGLLPLLSPLDRARCALAAGADAVFALPVLWTLRDAEHYALGAVALLSRLGITHLAFGAETDDLSLLQRAAVMLEKPTDEFQLVLRQSLDRGNGYPAALASALSAALPEAAGLLDAPNNTLAVCYLRALRRLQLNVEPVVIRRTGAYRANAVDPAAPSASALRAALLRGDYASAFRAVPAFSAAVLRRRFLDAAVPDERILDAALLSRLRAMPPEEYALLPDLSEGMENALRSAAAQACSMRGLVLSLAGKRYPAARISRLCACALLGIRQETLDSLALPERALLLGLRPGKEMTARWKSAALPVIASFPEWKKTAHPADLAAWRLFAQCCRLPDTLPFSEKTAVYDSKRK